MSISVRQLGTTALFAPQIKRAIGRHTDGRTLVFVPDTNRSDSNGADLTGVAKFYIYASTDSTRTAYTTAVTDTPATAPCSSTKKFVGSMAVNSDNDVFIAFQGTDNSLRLVSYNWNGTTYDAGVDQTIVAANAVTDRYRAIDIDVANSATGNPAVIVYEAEASSGVGSYTRVYVRLNDGTTWRKAYEVHVHIGNTIKVGSEDVSVSWGSDGIVSNVGRLGVYWTAVSTTADVGDIIREIDFNVSTGTDGSSTVIGSWFTEHGKGQASGSRRGWLFKNKTVGGTACWVFGGIVGLASPYYVGYKLHHNVFTGISQNKTVNSPSVAAANQYGAFTGSDRVSYAAQSCNWADGRLQFLYVGPGIVTYSNCMRSVVFRWPDSVEQDAVSVIDSKSRVLDNNYFLGDGSLAVYGGQNYLSAGAAEYSALTIYGSGGNTVSASPLALVRTARVIVEDSFAAPTVIQPVFPVVVAKDRVTFQVSSVGPKLYVNAKGKLQLQVATDAGYTTNLQTIEEDDSLFRTYQSSNGLATPYYFIGYELTEAQKLFTSTWFARFRIKDDLGGTSAWAESSFNVAHPPAALPRTPASGSIVLFTSGDVSFSWNFSDTEPVDNQTAYQIILTRLDTAAVVTDTGKVSSSVTGAVLTIAAALKNVALSYQIKLWDSDDNPGAFSDAVQFTVAEPPQVVITSPLDGGSVNTGLPTITWNFISTGLTQTHYRVVITNTDASPDEDVADTGWLSGSETSYTFLSQVLENSTNYQVLVYVRNSLGLSASAISNLIGNSSFEATVSGWTASSCTLATSSLFAHDGVKSLRITPSAACNIQSVSYPAVVAHEYRASAWVYSVAGWTNITVTLDWRDSVDASISTVVTTVAVPAATWTQIVATGIAPALTTQARVKIAMTNSPTGTDLLYVDDVQLYHTSTDFSTTWTPPLAGNIVLTSDKYKATISWTNANQDVDFVAWRVYRKYNVAASDDLDVDNTRNTWVLLYETTDVLTAYEYRDYFLPMNKLVSYIVVQLVDRFGSLIESNLPSAATVTLTADRYYFVPAVPIGAIASFEAGNVTSDSFRREVEQATLHIVGRGRQIQIGDDLGYDGELTLKLRNPATARSDREFIELLSRSDNAAIYIRSPFGDVLYVSFGSVSFDRMAGVGQGDLGDLTVPYVEVFKEVVITRTV